MSLPGVPKEIDIPEETPETAPQIPVTPAPAEPKPDKEPVPA